MFSERLPNKTDRWTDGQTANGQMDTRKDGHADIHGPVKRIRRSSRSPFLDAKH